METAKAILFDAFNGVSGDMILGALLDLGLPMELLQDQLAKLELGAYRLSRTTVERQGLQAVDFKVILDDAEKKTGESGRAHSHLAAGARSHALHRTPAEIRSLIQGSGLDPGVVEMALSIFRRLGEAEAMVHGTSLEAVHFHEVGGVDSIVDVVGSCIGFHYLGVERFYASPLALGGGTVSFSHGCWPVPAPATAELVRGFPVRTGPVDRELTTPTGAAIVTTLVKGPTPVLHFERSGFGAGDREFGEIPNLLRLVLARVEESAPGAFDEPVVLLEAAIDNMDGEMLGHVLERGLSEGALDVYYSPLSMKKSRPGVLLSVLVRPEDRDRMVELLFQETTTLGIRFSSPRRFTLRRAAQTVATEWGPVRVKVACWRGRVVNCWPEYEDLKRIALAQNLPLKRVRHKVVELIGQGNYE